MATSQWLLTRTASSESRIYEQPPLAKQPALLDRLSVQRVRLERSFTTAMRELKQLQQEREAASRSLSNPRKPPAPSP
jgi:hypothetical protein